MKKRILLLLKLAIGVVMLIVLIRTVNPDNILDAFRQPDEPGYIYAAIILLIPNLYLQYYRWYMLLKINGIQVTRRNAFSSLLGGMMLGFATPGRVGEAGRGLFLPDGDRIKIIGLLIIDKFYSFLCIIIGGLWGMILLLLRKFSYEPFIIIPAVLFGILISLLAISLMLHPNWIRTMIYNLSLILPYRDKLKKMISCFDNFDKKQGRRFFYFSLILYAIYILQFCLLARAFQPLGIEAVLSSTTAAILVKTLLPISIADIGIREGASVFFFLQYNIQKVTGFNAALLLFSINVLIPAVLGLFTIPMLGKGRKSNSDNIDSNKGSN